MAVRPFHIEKAMVKCCNICNKIKEPVEPPKPVEPQAEEVQSTEDAPMVVEKPEWPGVPGYKLYIKDRTYYSWADLDICEDCMNDLIRGVGLIRSNKITAVSL